MGGKKSVPACLVGVRRAYVKLLLLVQHRVKGYVVEIDPGGCFVLCVGTEFIGMQQQECLVILH